MNLEPTTQCPKARCAKFGRCERLGCNHRPGASVRICLCCMAQIGMLERDALTMLRNLARCSKEKQAAVSALEDKYLAILNELPARRPIDRQLRNKR